MGLRDKQEITGAQTGSLNRDRGTREVSTTAEVCHYFGVSATGLHF